MKRDFARELAQRSLEIGSIRLSPEQPFQWASGYYMPIYNDNRMLLARAADRELVAMALESLLEEEEAFDVVAGTATAGIPHATSLADRLKLPMVYVRSSAKGHGRGNQIEGVADARELSDRRLVLVEDLISTGGSSIRALEALRATGADLSLCLAIFTYGLDKASSAFAALEPECRCRPILDYSRMIAEARRLGAIDESAVKSLEAWREDPFGWGEANGFPPKQDA